MSRKCPACDCSTVSTALADQVHRYSDGSRECHWHYQVLRCAGCGLGFVDPEPDLSLVPTFYPENYGAYVRPVEADLDPRWSLKYWVAGWRYASWDRKARRALVPSFLGRLVELATGKTVSYSLGLPLQLPRDAHILEIGYGSGNWLRIMSDLGYTRLAGYDIAANASNSAALLSRGIEVSSGDFLANDYPEQDYDCIRLEHVFEHLLKPDLVLRKCRRLLKSGGLLVMTMPCINALSAQLSLPHYPNLDVPRHLFHHTLRSVELMVQNAGFDRIQSTSYSDAVMLLGTVNGLLRERSLPELPGGVASAVSPAYRLLSRALGRGEHLTLVARA